MKAKCQECKSANVFLEMRVSGTLIYRHKIRNDGKPHKKPFEEEFCDNGVGKEFIVCNNCGKTSQIS